MLPKEIFDARTFEGLIAECIRGLGNKLLKIFLLLHHLICLAFYFLITNDGQI